MEVYDWKNMIGGFLSSLGEDPSREGLLKTPERYLKAMEFLTSGYKADLKSLLQEACFSSPYESEEEVILVKDMEFYSLCEHHLLPFYGRCHVAYIPHEKVVGLSKIPRLVEACSRKLQMQERLTTEISQAFWEHLRPKGVGVILEGHHLCLMMRGVRQQGSHMVTSSLKGLLKDSPFRDHFFSRTGHGGK